MMRQPLASIDWMSDAKGLTTEQLESWQAFMQMQELLGSRLEQQLQRNSNLSNADYTVLVVLSETPGMRRRVYELGQMIGWEKSRLHHQLTRMARRGLVRREADPDAPRAIHAVLTDAGLAAITEAAPSHEQEVRRLFFDLLTDRQVAQIAKISHQVLKELLPVELQTKP
jgi:DNA-binding MarR family transcriptional regulator